VHRLSGDALAELRRTGLPLVLLGPANADAGPRGFVLPPDAEPAVVRETLLAGARAGELVTARAIEATPRRVAPPVARAEGAAALTVLAVAGGHGSPGRTTLAVNLAGALGSVAPTLLVDADMTSPSVAAYLDLDPTRNLYVLAHAEPDAPGTWERAIAQETPPLAAPSAYGAVLCGVPKPEMRAAVTSHFLERLVDELRRRHRYVVLDLGAELLDAEAVLHRAVLALADQVLLIASADLVGLSRARTALARLEAPIGLDPERVALVVNRHDERFHHGRAEIDWGLERPVAAMIPYDLAVPSARSRSSGRWRSTPAAGPASTCSSSPDACTAGASTRRPKRATRRSAGLRRPRIVRRAPVTAVGATTARGATDGDHAAAVP